MRKLVLGAAMLLFAQMGFGQAVSEYAIIPVSVTLNSVFRLTVVSGGNIEWVVNSIEQWDGGIDADARYETNFTVSASRDFSVILRPEDDDFLGQDNPANTLSLDNVGYMIRYEGVGGVEGTSWNIPSIADAEVKVPVAGGEIIIEGLDEEAAGDAAKNNFVIEWRLGTSEDLMNALSLLQQKIPTDRYVTNMFLELVDN